MTTPTYPVCDECRERGTFMDGRSDHPVAHLSLLPNSDAGRYGAPPLGVCVDVAIAGLVAGLNSRGMTTVFACQGYGPDDATPCACTYPGAGSAPCLCEDHDEDEDEDRGCGCFMAYLSFPAACAIAFVAVCARAGLANQLVVFGRPLTGRAGVYFAHGLIPALTVLFPHPGGDWTPVPVKE